MSVWGPSGIVHCRLLMEVWNMDVKRKGKVLVIDDSRQNRDLAEDTLSDAGFEVLLAANGEAGLKCAKAQRPDIVLLDVMMPGMNGFEICEILKSPQSGLEMVKVIMLTALAYTRDKIAGFSCGADDYLTKPYHPSELIARVNAQLRTKLAEDAVMNRLKKSKHMATIGQMASGIAHDFKNILSTSLVVELIREFAKDAEAKIDAGKPLDAKKELGEIKRFCDLAEQSILLGQTMVQGLTAFAFGAGSENKVHKLSSLLYPPVDILSKKINKQGVEKILNFEDKDVAVKCNGGEIQQVALNLIINALQAMEHSKEKILTIRLWTEDDRACFSVADSGSGIPENIREKIYDDYFTTKAEGKGTGIGLSTVKKIITAHNGKVDLVSKVGSGSTFTVSLHVYHEPD